MAAAGSVSKLGFKFSAVPRDRHPEWFNCTMLTRGLGLELYIASCAEDGKSRPIPVSSNWRTSLCRTLCVEPEERPGISQCFSAMEKRGLIKVEDGVVHVIWNPKDKLFKTPPAEPEQATPCGPAGLPLTDPCLPPVGGLRSPNPRNDSTHVSQREENRREERERAREADELDHQIRIGFSKRLERAAQAIPNQRSLGAAVASLVPWIEKTAPIRKLSEHELAERLLDGFFANENAKAKSYPPAFLANNPLEYLDAKPQLRAAKVPDGIPPIRNFGPKKEAI